MVTIACNGKVFENIHAVFLDKDGTLANVSSYLTRLGNIQAKLMERSVPGTHSLVLNTLGITPHGLTASGLLAVGNRQETILGTAAAAAMVGYPWLQAVDLATTSIAIAAQQCSPKAVYTPLLPGALVFLKRLKQARLKVIMVSADAQTNLDQFVEYYKLQSYFDKIQGVSREYPAKTAPDFLPAACRAVELSPDEGIVIGDAASDVRMAASARGFIGYLGGWQPLLTPRDILGDIPSSDYLAHGFATDFDEIVVSS